MVDSAQLLPAYDPADGPAHSTDCRKDVALFLSPPLSKLDLNTEKEMLFRYTAIEALETEGAPPAKPHPR